MISVTVKVPRRERTGDTEKVPASRETEQQGRRLRLNDPSTEQKRNRPVSVENLAFGIRKLSRERDFLQVSPGFVMVTDFAPRNVDTRQSRFAMN